MIFSVNGRPRYKSRRHSLLRRRAVTGISLFSGLIVLSLAVLSLVMANLPGNYGASPGYVHNPLQPAQQTPQAEKSEEQSILDQTLDKLTALETAAVEAEYDSSDAVAVYPGTDDEPADEPVIAEGELDQAAPADGESGEEVLAQKPADQPGIQNGPSGPSAPAHPGSVPDTASPNGQPSPQVAAAPRQPDSGSPFGGPSTPQNSLPGTGRAPTPATGQPSGPFVADNPGTPKAPTDNTPSGVPDNSPATPTGGPATPALGQPSPPVIAGNPGTPQAPTGNTPSGGPNNSPAAPAGGPASPAQGQPSPPVIAGNPGTPQAPTGNTPSGGDSPIDIPAVLNGPQIGDASDPTDDWFSPGHSPGIATVAGDFNLDGQTILFEILGTEAGLEYDQLKVDGIAKLNEGNVVFAFINGFGSVADPIDQADLFDLILADEVLVDLEKVNFYYGLFDPKNEPSYDLHGPHNLSLYTILDYKDSVEDDVTLYDGNGSASINSNGLLAFDNLMRINYMERGGRKDKDLT